MVRSGQSNAFAAGFRRSDQVRILIG
jgi:hypothetical protein